MSVLLAILLATCLTALGWVLIGAGSLRSLAFQQTEQLLAGQDRPGQGRSWAVKLIRAAGLMPPPDSPLHRDLALIGSPMTVEELYLYKFLAAAGCLVIAALVYGTGEGMIASFVLVMAVAAWGLPDARIRAEARKIRAEFSRRLPAFLQALAMMTEAGLNLHPAIAAYAQQDRTALGKELQLTMAEIQMGAPLAEALPRMAARCDVPELYRVVATLVQASERGTSGISETCRQLAAEAWGRRRDMARELGQKASSKMILPLLLLVLPTLFLFMIGPAVYNMMTNF